MRTRGMRGAWAAGVLGAALVLGTAGPGRAAGIPVFDASTFAQALVSANQAVRQVANQLLQIDHQVTMIAHQAQSLRTLDGGSTDALLAALAGQGAQVDAMLARVRGIGYGLRGVEEEFDALFPAGAAAAEPPPDLAERYARWGDQLRDAARTAMASQSAIAGIGRHGAEARRLLLLSSGADGEVRQLQAVNGMLAVLAGQLGDASAAIAATGRVTASAAAGRQAERDAERATLRRFTRHQAVPVDDGKHY